MNRKKAEITIHSEEELKVWIPTFLNILGDRKVLAFTGDLGSGKTTFIKHLCAELGVTEWVSSPSFSIVNEYQTNDGDTIYHIDVYRLKSLEEALQIGIEEYLDSDCLVCIEWPILIWDLLPLDTVQIKIEAIGPEERKIVIL